MNLLLHVIDNHSKKKVCQYLTGIMPRAGESITTIDDRKLYVEQVEHVLSERPSGSAYHYQQQAIIYTLELQ